MTRTIGQGHIRSQELGHGGIDALAWNRHVWPRNVGCGIGIKASGRHIVVGIKEIADLAAGAEARDVGHVNGDPVIGEVSVAGIFCGDSSRADRTCFAAEPFVAGKEEGLIPKNFAARRGAKLIVPKRRLGCSRAG